MTTQIKGNLQNEVVALLLASAQIKGHGDSWIEGHSTSTGSDDDDYAYIMEWISQCFTLRANGDVAAVASQLSVGKLPPAQPAAAQKPGTAAQKSGTASAPPKMSFAKATSSAAPAPAPKPAATSSKVRLLVANNDGRNIAANYKTFSNAFVAVLNEKIKQDGNFYGDKRNLTKGVDDIMQVVVEHGWPRIASKISKIKEALTPPPSRPGQPVQGQVLSPVEKLNSIIDSWVSLKLFNVKEDFVAQIAPTTAPKKPFTPEQIYAQHIDILKGHAQKVVNANPTAPSLNTSAMKSTFLREICDSCKHLLQAIEGVINRSQTRIPEEQLYLVKRVRRRLWRVLRYSAGPQKFLLRGREILKNKIGNGNTNTILYVEPYWVAEDSMLVTLFSTPAQNITMAKDTFVNWFKSEFTNTLPEGKQKNDAIAAINRTSNKQLSWNLSVHCEVALLTFLYLTDANIISHAIGVSKLNCYACNVYTNKLKTTSGSLYTMTGTSGKTHHRWLIPNSNVFSEKPALKIASIDGTKDIAKECKEDIKYFLTSNARRNSTGSDSSTGSGALSASKVFLLGSERQ